MEVQTASPVAQAGPSTSVRLTRTMNLWSSCLHNFSVVSPGHHACFLTMPFLFLFVCACARVSTHICVGVCIWRTEAKLKRQSLGTVCHQDVGLLAPGSASTEIQLPATVSDFLFGFWNWSSGLLAFKKAEPPSSSNPAVIS